MVEEVVHVAAEGFVVAVDGGPGGWWSAAAGDADTGEDGGDDVIAQGEDGDDGSGRLGVDVVAAAAARFVDEVVAAEFAEVVGGLAERCRRCCR